MSTRFVQVRLRDDQIEDGDRIKVELNGQVLAGYADYTLTKAGKILTLELQTGDNELKVTALNEGELPPNTTKVIIDSDKVISGSSHQLSSGLKTGQSEPLKFTVR